jgi:hypothetical protein
MGLSTRWFGQSRTFTSVFLITVGNLLRQQPQSLGPFGFVKRAEYLVHLRVAALGEDSVSRSNAPHVLRKRLMNQTVP